MANGFASADMNSTGYLNRTSTGPWTSIAADYPLTLGAWVNFDTSVTGEIGFLWIGDSTSHSSYCELAWFGSAAPSPNLTLNALARGSGGGTGGRANTTSTINSNQWYWVVGQFEESTVDPSSCTTYMYLDGVFEDQGPTGSGNAQIPANWNLSTVGRTADASPRTPFPGKVAYAHVYNRRISLDEINEIMHKPFSITDGLVWAIPGYDDASAVTDYKDLSGLAYNISTGVMPTPSVDGPPVFFY